jgi:hypothetical protein
MRPIFPRVALLLLAQSAGRERLRHLFFEEQRSHRNESNSPVLRKVVRHVPIRWVMMPSRSSSRAAPVRFGIGNALRQD